VPFNFRGNNMSDHKEKEEEQEEQYNNSSYLYTTPTTNWPFAKKQRDI
jgi:hypothetical protein